MSTYAGEDSRHSCLQAPHQGVYDEVHIGERYDPTSHQAALKLLPSPHYSLNGSFIYILSFFALITSSYMRFRGVS